MRELQKAIRQMEATRARTEPVRALRSWRQEATKAALGSIVKKSRKGAGK